MTTRTVCKRLGSAIAGSALALMMTACVDGTQLAEGGIRGTGMSIGPVTAFGSIYVNGVRFATDGQVVSNDGISFESELDEGMVLIVEGQWQGEAGDATRVHYDDTVRGEVGNSNNWDAATKSGSLEVLNHTVLLDGQTVFRGKAPDQIQSGDYVRISGWRLAEDAAGTGRFRASYVRTGENPSAFGGTYRDEIEGIISGLDTGPATTFELNGLTVNYNLADFDGMAESDLENGLYVEVEGRLDGAVLQAEEIEREAGRYRGTEGDDIEFSGAVASAFNPGTGQFSMAGLAITVTADDLDDALTLTDLQPGLLIKVEGAFDSQGSVVAEEIELREANAELEGKLDIIDGDSLTLGGVRVLVNTNTIIVDDDDDARISLENLTPGEDYLEAEGLDTSDSEGPVLLAVKIERDDDDDDDFKLTGRVAGVSDDPGYLTVLGVRIETDTQTRFNGANLSSLADLQTGDWVEVAYRQGVNRFIADEIEREEDDD